MDYSDLCLVSTIVGALIGYECVMPYIYSRYKSDIDMLARSIVHRMRYYLGK